MHGVSDPEQPVIYISAEGIYMYNNEFQRKFEKKKLFLFF